MNPISRLRTRACSAAFNPVTSAPLIKYFPSVAECSSPITDNSVDFPQPDGPLMETYSPCSMDRSMPSSAEVSSSSVLKIFLMLCKWISDSVFMGLAPTRNEAHRPAPEPRHGGWADTKPPQ